VDQWDRRHRLVNASAQSAHRPDLCVAKARRGLSRLPVVTGNVEPGARGERRVALTQLRVFLTLLHAETVVLAWILEVDDASNQESRGRTPDARGLRRSNSRG
jgi:hypothetical protein